MEDTNLLKREVCVHKSISTPLLLLKRLCQDSILGGHVYVLGCRFYIRNRNLLILFRTIAGVVFLVLHFNTLVIRYYV